MGENLTDASSDLTLARAQAIVRQHRKKQARRWMKRARMPAVWILFALALLWTIRAWLFSYYQPWRTGLSAASLVFTTGVLLTAYAPASLGRRKLVAVGAAGLLAVFAFAGGGGLRYTYGSEGELAYAYTMEATQIVFGVNTSILAVGTITNIGTATVRLAPDFSIKAIGPDGVPVDFHQEGCGIVQRLPYDDRAFVEVAAGTSRSYGLGFSVVWVANASAPPPPQDLRCGAFVLHLRGTYQVIAVVSSGPLFEATTLPVWSGSVPAPVTPFTAS